FEILERPTLLTRYLLGILVIFGADSFTALSLLLLVISHALLVIYLKLLAKILPDHLLAFSPVSHPSREKE
ncbi:MAG TPA: hypothetical protein VK619_12135, partial [Pyrinomonadaceae bacterium]|nr:hypothetical protein [Pyrinomonadaceae bacterium]